MYSKTTNNIRITVTTRILNEEQANYPAAWFPHAKHWGYIVKFENLGDREISVSGRWWKVVDDNDKIVEEKFSAGIFTDHPIIAPGKSFEFADSTNLKAETGILTGRFEIYWRDIDESWIAELPEVLFEKEL